MDVMSKEQRHRCMARIKGKNTKPELVVRRFLWSHGFRYRINYKRLPGKPDIVLTKLRTVIMVNGCFWHGHEGCEYYRLPKTNVEYWENKIETNKLRDQRDREQLVKMGWNVVQIWECQLKAEVKEKYLEGLLSLLENEMLKKYGSRYDITEDDVNRIAAEPAEPLKKEATEMQ